MLQNMLKAKQKKAGIKYHFGVRVPRISKEALDLDSSKGNTLLIDAMEKGKKYYC